MKREIVKAIRIMGIGTNEVLMDFYLSIGFFESIEWSPSDGDIWLHMFSDDGFQISVEWDDLSNDDKMEVYIVLRSILYN